jgi:hypothetical protein
MVNYVVFVAEIAVGDVAFDVAYEIAVGDVAFVELTYAASF